MPFQLVVVKGRSANQALRIPTDGVTTVGRVQGCQIRIASSQVSRKHCELFEKKGHLLVKDLSSSNGTIVNGKKVEGQQVLEPGSILTIGSVVFRVETVSASEGAPVAGRPADTAVSQSATGRAVDELDYEIEADSETRIPLASPDEQTISASADQKKPVASQSHASNGDEGKASPEMGEEDVADFLLDLDVDVDDQR